jgi:hypothetical protein
MGYFRNCLRRFLNWWDLWKAKGCFHSCQSPFSMYRYMWSSNLLLIDWWKLLASVALQPSLLHFPYIHVPFLLRRGRIPFGYTISIFLFLFINYYVIGHRNSHNQMWQ